MEDYLNPPQYCPDALATDVGWINPRNGELLVSIRNLRQKLAERDAAKVSVAVVREDERSDTQKILDKLTASLPERENQKSVTERLLDSITASLPAREDQKTETEKILDIVSSQATQQVGRQLTLVLDDVSAAKDAFGAPPPPKVEVQQVEVLQEETVEEPPVQPKRARGRPRKNT